MSKSSERQCRPINVVLVAMCYCWGLVYTMVFDGNSWLWWIVAIQEP